MRVALISPIWMNTPPPLYGGTEEVVANIANGLVEKGHDVTLFAPATAHTKARLSPTVSIPLHDKDISWNDISYNLYHLTQAFDYVNETSPSAGSAGSPQAGSGSKKFDIIHMHLNKNIDYAALPLGQRSATPTLFTFHFDLPSETTHPDRYQLLCKYKDLPFTSISFAQRAQTPLNFIETVYNGIELSHYPFSPTAKEYYLWLGKIVPHKGTKEAILAAKKAGVTLIIAGVVDKGVPESVAYFEKEIRPRIDNTQIVYAGPVGLAEKATLLGGAKALLNPIIWNEPFGLVMGESLACGTPVIAFANGASPEIIQDGTTGFLVSTVDEMAEKIPLVDSLKRDNCRQSIEEKFTTSLMVEGYVTAYKAAIEHWETYQLASHATAETYRDKPAEVITNHKRQDTNK